ncbi:MAG: RNA methyltransferase [Patescibacteria group bacterium]|nr:RNA methyltransferase [Patescibacteria group bacterium]
MFHLVLDNIRSLHNVGSLFRTGDGAGFSHMHLCENTGVPPRKEISKTALGAEEFVSWQHWSDTEKCIKTLKSKGFYIVAMEISDTSVDYRELDFSQYDKVALVLGNEVHGVRQHIQELCDAVVHLPMRGQKGSLNVCQAASVLMYEILRSR